MDRETFTLLEERFAGNNDAQNLIVALAQLPDKAIPILAPKALESFARAGLINRFKPRTEDISLTDLLIEVSEKLPEFGPKEQEFCRQFLGYFEGLIRELQARGLWRPNEA